MYHGGELHEACDRCGAVGSVKNPDVFFQGEYFEPHFATDGQPHGQVVTSKSHKAQIMRELGVRESGDKVHGSR